MKKLFILFFVVLLVNLTAYAQAWQTKYIPGKLLVDDLFRSNNSFWLYSSMKGGLLLKMDLSGSITEEYEVGSQQKLLIDQSGTPYFVQGKQLNKWNSATLETVDFPVDFGNLNNKSIRFDEYNNLEIIHNDTLHYQKNGTWHFISLVPMITELCNRNRTGYPCSWQLNTSFGGVSVEDKHYGVVQYDAYNNYQLWAYDSSSETFEFLEIDKPAPSPFVSYTADTSFFYTPVDGLIALTKDSAVKANALFDDIEEIERLDGFDYLAKRTYVDTIWQDATTFSKEYKTEYNSFRINGGIPDEQNDWNQALVFSDEAPSQILKASADTFLVQFDQEILLYSDRKKIRNIAFETEASCLQEALVAQDFNQYRQPYSIKLWKDGYGEVWFHNKNILSHSADNCDRNTFDSYGHQYYKPLFVSNKQGHVHHLRGTSYYEVSQLTNLTFENYILTYDGDTLISSDTNNYPMIFENNDKVWVCSDDKVWFTYVKYDLDRNRIGTYLGNFHNNQWAYFEDKNYGIITMFEDKAGQLRAIDKHSLYQFSENTWTEIAEVPDAEMDISNGVMSANGDLWLTLEKDEQAYLGRYDGANWLFEVMPSDLNTTALKADKQTGVWLMSENGVCYTSNQSDWICYDDSHGLPDEKPNDLEIASSGKIWLSYLDHVSSFLPERLIANTTKNTFEVSGFYPNPTHDFIYLREESVDEVSIYSLQGQFIRQYNSTSIIDVSQLKTGIYILDLEHAGQHTSYQLVKE